MTTETVVTPEQRRRFDHEWHVAINRYGWPDGKPSGDFDTYRFMYEAKEVASEVPRLAQLFRFAREGKLAKVHQQCSFSAPEAVAENYMTCCLGVKCAECPFLKALDAAALPVDEIDRAKAWTCATHIISKGGDHSREGYILTVDDRMFWDRTYANMAAPEPQETDDG